MTDASSWTGGAERRARPRKQRPDGVPPLTATVGKDLWNAPVRDISSDGVGLVLDRRLDPGSLLPVELLNRTWNCWHLKLIRVVHVTPHGEQQWIIGSAFLKSLGDEELSALLT